MNVPHEYKSPLSLTLRIDWSELDLFGHVNNVMFLKYVQAARVNYWEILGLSDLYEKTGTGPLLASTSCQFKKTLHYPGQITIETRADFMKTTSIGLSHRIIDESREIAAEANDVLVLFDFNKKQKTEIPGWMRKKVEELEGKSFLNNKQELRISDD